MSKQNHHRLPEELEKDILKYKKKIEALERQLTKGPK